MNSFFRDIKTYREYILWSARSSLKAEVVESRLGWLWWLLEPALFMLVYFFVFSVVFHRSGIYATAFIYTGLIFWRFFTRTVTSCVELIKKQKKIISRIYIPKCVFVLSLMVVNGFKLLVSFLFVIPLMIYYRVPLSWHILELVPLIFCWLVFTFGISCICMNVGVFFEDLKKLLEIGFRILFYISGVFYSIKEHLTTVYANIALSLNPVAFQLSAIRDSLLYSVGCDWTMLLVWFMISVALSIIGLCLLYYYEDRYVKVI